MKRLFLTLALVFGLVATAAAQINVGGRLGATMSTFQRVNQNLSTDRSDDLVTHISAISTTVRIRHSHPGRIGKHAEIRIL